MKMEHHALITAPVVMGVYYFTNSWFYTSLSFFLGFLVDFDHVFDYIREEKRFDFKDLFIKSYAGDFKKIYIVFHAYEYIPVAWVVSYVIQDWTFAIVFTVSYLIHMIPDQFANNVKPFGYFFIYRLIKNFRMKEIFNSPKGIEPGFIRKRSI